MKNLLFKILFFLGFFQERPIGAEPPGVPPGPPPDLDILLMDAIKLDRKEKEKKSLRFSDMPDGPPGEVYFLKMIFHYCSTPLWENPVGAVSLCCEFKILLYNAVICKRWVHLLVGLSLLQQ